MILHAVTPEPQRTIIFFLNSLFLYNISFSLLLLNILPDLFIELKGMLILPCILPLITFFLGSASMPSNLFLALHQLLEIQYFLRYF